jgi:magnesium-transporting ATPase (P-type)
LVEKEKKSPFLMILAQFKDFLILILIAAAVLAGYVGDLVHTIAMTTFHAWEDGVTSFTKGALDVLLEKVTQQFGPEGPQAWDVTKIQQIHERMAADGLRAFERTSRSLRT